MPPASKKNNNRKEDSLKDKTKEKDENNNEIKIGKYEDAPNFLKDNEFIKTGYLINCNTVNKVFRSLFKWSNETINVWSHLLGCVLAMIFIFYCSNYIKDNKDIILIKSEQLLNNFKSIINLFIQKINEFKIINNKENYINSFLETIITNSKNIIEKILLNKISFLQNIGDYINEINNQIKQVEKININNNNNNNNNLISNITKELNFCKKELYEFMNKNNNYNYNYVHYNNNILKKWPLFIMLVSAIICLGFSATFHLFGIYNKKINKILSRLDYGGIMFLVAGSCYPPYYYFFYCEKYLKFIYLFGISFSAFCLFIFTLTPDFDVPEKRNLRGICFLTIGISTSIPILHLTFFPNTISGFYDSPHLKYWYYGGLSYVIGGIIYILRIPEKYFKGKFDIIGHSHQILHLFVVLGFILHYLGCLDSYYYRLNRECPNNI